MQAPQRTTTSSVYTAHYDDVNSIRKSVYTPLA